MASRNPHKRYTEAHWGIPPQQVYHFEGPQYDPYPSKLVEMGKLHQLQYRRGKGGPIQAIGFEGDSCILAFSPDKAEKLYPLYPVSDALKLAERFGRPGPGLVDLQELNASLPGRQAKFPFMGEMGLSGKRDYRVDLLVRVIGDLQAVSYIAEKKGDGLSTYHHTFGEESGILPVLACDVAGRLWIVAGAYSVPSPGITD